MVHFGASPVGVVEIRDELSNHEALLAEESIDWLPNYGVDLPA
jgi:hypothetical protein